MAQVRHFERENVVINDHDADVHESRVVHSGAYVAAEIVDYILGLAEILMGLRFLFKLFAANPNTGFVSFIYGVTDPLVAPFRAIFGTSVAQGSVFEWSTLIGMVVYAIVAWAIIRLIEIGNEDRTEYVG